MLDVSEMVDNKQLAEDQFQNDDEFGKKSNNYNLFLSVSDINSELENEGIYRLYINCTTYSNCICRKQ